MCHHDLCPLQNMSTCWMSFVPSCSVHNKSPCLTLSAWQGFEAWIILQSYQFSFMMSFRTSIASHTASAQINGAFSLTLYHNIFVRNGLKIENSSRNKNDAVSGVRLKAKNRRGDETISPPICMIWFSLFLCRRGAQIVTLLRSVGSATRVTTAAICSRVIGASGRKSPRASTPVKMPAL